MLFGSVPVEDAFESGVEHDTVDADTAETKQDKIIVRRNTKNTNRTEGS